MPRPQPIPSASLFLSWSWSLPWSLWSREVEGLGRSGVGVPRVGDVATRSPDPGPDRIRAGRPGCTCYVVLPRPTLRVPRRQLTAAGCGRDRACRARGGGWSLCDWYT
jgi:hypothetical protein